MVVLEIKWKMSFFEDERTYQPVYYTMEDKLVAVFDVLHIADDVALAEVAH